MTKKKSAEKTVVEAGEKIPGKAGKFVQVMQETMGQRPEDCALDSVTIARVDSKGHIRMETDNLTYEQATALAAWIQGVYG